MSLLFVDEQTPLLLEFKASIIEVIRDLDCAKYNIKPGTYDKLINCVAQELPYFTVITQHLIHTYLKGDFLKFFQVTDKLVQEQLCLKTSLAIAILNAHLKAGNTKLIFDYLVTTSQLDQILAMAAPKALESAVQLYLRQLAAAELDWETTTLQNSNLEQYRSQFKAYKQWHQETFST